MLWAIRHVCWTDVYDFVKPWSWIGDCANFILTAYHLDVYSRSIFDVICWIRIQLM